MSKLYAKHLKHFNLENIYQNPKIKEHSQTINDLFADLFNRFISDIEKDNHGSVIFTSYLEDMASEYTDNHNSAEIVRDFIAGMTDQYFLSQFPPEIRPKRIEFD